LVDHQSRPIPYIPLVKLRGHETRSVFIDKKKKKKKKKHSGILLYGVHVIELLVAMVTMVTMVTVRCLGYRPVF
jgi:hypothetical protein